MHARLCVAFLLSTGCPGWWEVATSTGKRASWASGLVLVFTALSGRGRMRRHGCTPESHHPGFPCVGRRSVDRDGAAHQHVGRALNGGTSCFPSRDKRHTEANYCWGCCSSQGICALRGFSRALNHWVGPKAARGGGDGGGGSMSMIIARRSCSEPCCAVQVFEQEGSWI